MVEEKEEEEEEWEDGEQEKQEEEQAETMFIYSCNKEIFGTFLVSAKSLDSIPTVTPAKRDTRTPSDACADTRDGKLSTSSTTGSRTGLTGLRSHWKDDCLRTTGTSRQHILCQCTPSKRRCSWCGWHHRHLWTTGTARRLRVDSNCKF